MDLVIMAAGLGSRFGGLKQLEPVDENNNFIIDYSVFDAIRAGFDHIVFVIKEEMYDLFRQTIGKRLEPFISIDYAFQNFDNIPSIYKIPNSRNKPFGTGHAILCAKNKIKSDFAVINADDFYGQDSFKIAFNFLKINSNQDNYALIAYKAINTINNSGTVKRGICYHEQNNLKKIIESTIEILDDGTLYATPIISNEKGNKINNDQLVSMNLFAFSKKFLTYLENYFMEFLESNKNDLSSCEFFLPSVVSNLLESNQASASILSTNSKWFGITYKEDLLEVKSAIKNMKNNSIYPENLWDN